MQYKDTAVMMEKQVDSGFSSIKSEESPIRTSDNCCKESGNNLDAGKSAMPSRWSCNISEIDECETCKDFKWSEEVKVDILKLPYDFFYRQDNEGDTRLHATITLGLLEASYWLINLAPHPCLLDIANDDGLTALHLAVMARDAQVVRRLVLSGANKLLRTASGSTPLHLACAINDADCVKALVEPLASEERYCLASFGKRMPVMLNRDLEMRNFNGQTSLHIAASQGHLEVVRQLLLANADVNAREGLRGMTALHLALERSHTDVVWLLANERPFCIDGVTYAGLTTYEIAKSLDRRLADKLVRHRFYCDNTKLEQLDVEKELSAFARMRLCLAT